MTNEDRERAVKKLRSFITAIELFCDEGMHMDDNDREEVEAYTLAIEALESQKIGHWEDIAVFSSKDTVEEVQSAKCSVCGKYHTTPYTYYFSEYSYCPSCGAKMIREG